MSRIPASQSGSVAKLFDFACPACGHKFESMAKQADIDSKTIVCPLCTTPADKLISAVGVDGHAAAAWRR